MDLATLETLPERERNERLRRADWRFLLGGVQAPTVDRPRQIGFPRRRSLATARAELPPGGELLCRWRMPRLLGTQRARRRLLRAGFTDPRLLWPGPVPNRLPQFWLPPDSPPAAAHLLAGRPAHSALQKVARPLWRFVARLGLLAPVFALARAPGGTSGGDTLAGYLPPGAPCLLLSGGGRSINKVVALPFVAEEPRPSAVVKFARLGVAERALEREAEALKAVERAHPELDGVPRVLTSGRRGGGLGLAETAIYGRPLIDALAESSFSDLAELVTAWLVELGRSEKQPSEDWRERLVERPLAGFERDFGPVAAPSTLEDTRALLSGLRGLPQVVEHRDCSPWNVVLTAEGTPALLDWESAEPRGLPGLDLAYFLANAAFVLDGAIESGQTRGSYARLLDPNEPRGAIFARCSEEYRAALGLDPADLKRLRALAWIVHAKSDHRHAAMAGAGSPQPARLRHSTYLGLLEEELARQ